jgi:hypothetical protein
MHDIFTLKRVIFGIALIVLAVLALRPLESDMMLYTAQAQNMPVIESTDLNKKTIVWPRDFTAERTLIFIAFSQSQQGNIDAWVNGMKLKAAGAPVWFEIPMISDPGSAGRWFINSGMRSGIPSKADRARVVTVYGNKAAMMKAMGLTSEKQIYAIVVDKTGKIIARASGNYTETGAAELMAALIKK